MIFPWRWRWRRSPVSWGWWRGMGKWRWGRIGHRAWRIHKTTDQFVAWIGFEMKIGDIRQVSQVLVLTVEATDQEYIRWRSSRNCWL
jgi:hypothetical protein